MRKAVVISHIAFEDLGTLKDSLRGLFSIKILNAGFDTISDEILKTLAPDLFIVLGGPIGVYDNEDFPFLKQEIKYLKYRIKHNLPTIGICLGAQLIAAACNANVYFGGTKEIGWSPISLTNAGKDSPFNLFSDNPELLHWHGDTFELPKNATLLASTHLYKNQAFHIGNIIALQFHAEITQRSLEKWFIGHISEINNTKGISVEQLRQDSAKNAPNLEKIAPTFWSDLLNFIGIQHD